MPVLVGVGQHTERASSADGATPIEMMARASELAIADAAQTSLFDSLSVVAASGLTVDARQVNTPVSGMVKNVPWAVAQQLGLNAEQYVYAETGGNTPQMLVNHFAKQIAAGQAETVLLCGGEALSNMSKRFNHWSQVLLPKGKWKNKLGPAPSMLGETKAGNSDYEGRYHMNLPANVYPMFENALRAHYGRSVKQHQQAIADLFSKLTKVAADNPYAWFPQIRSAEELLAESQANRMIAFPYTKRLNSMILVNQSAAVVMTTLAKAKSMGISSDKMVFLHGYADGNDIWHVSERENFYSSPAMRQLGAAALAMAGKGIDDIAAFDIYSCFPSAVQIACDELGVSHSDSRGLSLTGGLPYFGGPGNNYSMHAIVEMVNWARSNANEAGLLNANGWYLTKHAFGVYSAQRPTTDLAIVAPQHQSPSGNEPRLCEVVEGEAVIETYTVVYDKNNQPSTAIIIAQCGSGERCLATTDDTPDTLARLLRCEAVGLSGQLRRRGKKTVFEF